MSSVTEKTYSWEKLDAATSKAMDNIRVLAERLCGPDPIAEQALRHKKKSYPATVKTYSDLFKALNEHKQEFSAQDFFDYVNIRLSPKKLQNAEPEVVEVNRAALDALLEALAIKEQFYEYTSSIRTDRSAPNDKLPPR